MGARLLSIRGEAYDGTFEMITTEHPSISAEELELLWVDYPKLGEYDQLIRLDRIPQVGSGNASSNTRTRSFLRLGSISSETSNVIKNLRSDDAYLRRALRTKVPDPDPKRKSTRCGLFHLFEVSRKCVPNDLVDQPRRNALMVVHHAPVQSDALRCFVF